MSDGDACGRSCGYCGRCDNDARGNATCSDCGEDFWMSAGDVGSLCDTCCEQRDVHTSAVEIRMAKARLKVTAEKDVA